MFLEFILEKFIIVNKIFQSVKPIVSKTKHRMTLLINELFAMYLKEDYIKSANDIMKINPESTDNMKDLEDINVGPAASNFLLNKGDSLTMEEKESFFYNCQLILIRGCKKLQKRFKFDEPWIHQKRFFHPKNCLNEAFHKEFPDLYLVFSSFPFIHNYDSNKNKKFTASGIF